QQYAEDLDAVKAAIELLAVLQSDLAFVREQAHDPQPAELPPESEPEAPQSEAQAPTPSGDAEARRPAQLRADEPSYEPRLRDRDERLDDEPSVGAELAPASSLARELAQQAGGSLSDERAASPAPAPAPAPTSTKQVLLAHGPNERWLQAVTSLLERSGK